MESNSRMTKRLQKDLEAMQRNFSDQFNVVLVDDNIKHWHVKITGPEGSVYEKEEYKLQFKFSPEYPIEAPEVVFVGPGPDHEHIYSNGFICMSILYDVECCSDCFFYMSIYCEHDGQCNQEGTIRVTFKSRPFNDAEFCKRSQGKGPKQFIWTYDDDKA